MIELPNPFEYISGTVGVSAGPTVFLPAPLTGDEAAEAFPRGFDPLRFLAEIESPSTTPLLDPSEVETMIIEALAGLSRRS